MIKKFFKDILTTADNETFDEGRVLIMLGCLVMAAGGVGAIIKGTLDFVAFGGGFGGLLTGGGALLIMKHRTEPQIKVTSDDGTTQIETKA
jgi:hypothetical protein